MADDATTPRTTFGAEIDDPVGGLNEIEVVLDDDDRVPAVDQALQDSQQQVDIVEMEAGGRFIEDIEGFPRSPFAQFARKFDPLCFATG